MTGYLQRLVLSAMKPAPRVHPVLTPMFSPPQDRTEDERVPTDDVASSAIPLQESAPSTKDAESSSTKLQGNKPATGSIPVVPTSHPSPESHPERLSAQSASQRIELSPQHAIAGGHVRPTETREPSDTYSEYVPLLPEVSAQPSLQDDVPPVQSQRPMPQGRRENGGRTRSASPTKSTPDEIQITIGRIEVTAIPETRARPAVKASRKPLSLDEYLKRADARRR